MESKSINNLIDRDVLKREVRDVVFRVADTPLSNDAMSKLVFRMGELVCKKIDDAPGVDAEPVRHGRWLEHYPNDIWDCYQCSCCKARRANKTKYCPNCGAKMDGDANAPKS